MAAHPEHSQDAWMRHNRELRAVNELAEALTLGKGVEAVIATALARITTLMDADAGFIYLLDGEDQSLKLKASQGIFSPDLEIAMANLSKPGNPLQCVLETGRAIAIGDVRKSPQPLTELAPFLMQAGIISWACAPLKMEGEVIGVYHLGAYKAREYNSHDLVLLEVIGNVVGTSLSNARLLVELRHKEGELRRALRRAVELQEEERKRLARELHDEIGQALTSILIQLKSLSEETNVPHINERINDLRALTSQTIEELRRLAMDLRPAALDNLGIIPALHWYVKQCAERTGLDIQFLAPERHERLSPEIELTLYRVAQEGVNNAIRHGKAQKIVVLLERDLRSSLVRLTVSDNGVGFDAAALDRGLGLVGIRERVELLRGSLQIEAAPGAGTHLSVEIPLKR
ncbi:MAG: GAF domain-containing sensor histidine kinase [Anaerolineales bacterium]|nr:GAF domain-containing sensor histidine kinase [Anaerolineales bacterium]